jgi:predicted nuclease of predicted toxin-antitoxin system
VRFLADMGVDVRVVEWLGRSGHDTVHLRDEGLQRAPDEQTFAKALAKHRIVLTFDLDFGDLAALTHEPAARVILFRLRNTRAARQVQLDSIERARRSRRARLRAAATRARA